jgi:hypothetical protein
MFKILLLAISFSVFSQIPDPTYIGLGNNKLMAFQSHDIESVNPDIEKAIITIHGSTRNAGTYYKSVARMAKRLGLEKSTFVLSPNFKERGDSVIGGEFIYNAWGFDWWVGNNSIDKSRTSSFEVIDLLVEKFADKIKFPNLSSIVITGHSAGGHLTQRYALGSVIENKYPDIKFKYIVANPGTYAYLNQFRPVSGHRGQFEIPNVRCAYNNYKYGMDRRNQYMTKNKLKTMIDNFLTRNVVYLLGENDIGDVEQSCEAQVQGPNRFVRGVNFKSHLDKFYPQNSHSLISVPNVGHTQYGMYTSELGSEVLFY